MKTSILRYLATITFLLLTAITTSRGADGSWNVDADGDWGVAGNWLGNIIADGPGSNAYFTNDTTTIRTVTTVSRTNGNLFFGDGDPIGTPGGWVVSGGTITLSNAAAKPIINVAPINAGDATNDVRITAGSLAGGQGFVKQGLGTLTLNTANTMGPVQIDSGIITIANATALGAGNQTVTFNGGGVRVYTGGPNFANTNLVVGSGTIISSNGNYDAYNGVWQGSGTMYIHATGRFTPGAGFNGTFTNFFGTIDLSDSPNPEVRINLGSGTPAYDMRTVTLNTGTNTGRFSFRNTGPGAVRIGALTGGPGTRLMSSEQGGGVPLTWEVGYLNQSTVFDGTIQNRNGDALRVGHFTKVGTGKLTLNGTNTYTGNTTVSNGILALGPTGSINTVTSSVFVVSSTATFDVSAFTPAWTNTTSGMMGGGGVITGSVALLSGTLRPGNSVGQLTFANDLYLDGTGTGTTNLAEIGTGTNDLVYVAGNLNLTGVIAVRVLPVGPVIADGTYPLFKWGGTLSGDLSNLALEYPVQGGTLTLGTNLVTKTIFLQASSVPTSLNLTWRGDGAANAWNLTTPNWRAGAVATTFSSGDKVTFDNSGSNNVPVDITTTVSPASITVNSANSYVFSTTGGGTISGGGSLFKTNSGMLTITTDNDYLGDTTNAMGTLKIGSGLGTGTLGAGKLVNNGTTIFDREAGSWLFSSVIEGTGSLVKMSSDTLALSGANTYSGNSVISNGTLRAETTASLGSGAVVIAGGTLNPAAAVNNPIQVIADGLIFATVSDLSINGTLSGSAGTLSFSGTGNGFRFAQTTSFTFNRPIDLLSVIPRTIAFYNTTSTQTYNGVISGGGGLHRRAPSAGFANDAIGGHTIFNGANTYSGGTTLSEGNVGLGSSTVLDVDLITILSGPLGTFTITYTPPAQVIAPFGWVALYAVGGPRTIANPIAFGAGTYDETGEPLTLDGTNDMTFSGAVTLSHNAGIRVNNARANVFSGQFTETLGGLGLTKMGPGALTLSGDNQYTGDTIVAGGTLLVQNTPGGTGSGTGLGNVSVSPGATLGGNGSIFGIVTNNGTISPGTSIGVLAISNALQFSASGTALMELNATTSTNDQVVGLTGIVYGGTLQLNNLGGTYTNGQTFKLFSSSSYSGAFASVSPSIPAGGQTWNTNNLTVNGTISVVGSAVSQPVTITNLTRLGNGSIQFSFSGASGQNYRVWSSTNLANRPITNLWTLLSSGAFGGSPVVFTDSVNTNSPQRFYIISQP